MIYLDHHAATPLHASAARAMEGARNEGWANPGSIHRAGRAARKLLEHARAQVAEVIGAQAADVVLTGGGTEACNLGVLGLGNDARRVITTAIEHPAVARATQHLERRGIEVVTLHPSGGTWPSPDEVASHVIEGTLVAIQWVNHETGTVVPVREWATACRARGARVFVDATQALGKVPVDIGDIGDIDVAAVAFAAHKMGGPAGAGALWIRRGCELADVSFGGAQERGRRPGTPDVVGHVGFGAACTVLAERLDAMPRIATFRDRLEQLLRSSGASINGAEGSRVATVVNASVPGWRGDELIAALDLDGVCASSGAACSSGLSEPSPVLRALYPDEPWRATSALRLSLGVETREEDIGSAEEILGRILVRRRK